MSAVARARCAQCLGRIKWLVVLLVIVVVLVVLTSAKFGATVELLTPPVLPPQVQVDHQQWLAQNWEKNKIRNQFHHISQGTRTLPIPYEWFLALEKPSDWLIGIPFATSHKLSDNDYLLRFGFIQGKKTPFNPDILPIGFAETPLQNLSGLDYKANAIGLTCAACHTGQVVYDKVQYVIEGGSSMVDLGQLTKALGAALGQIALSSKIPFFDYRFDRFAHTVLKDQFSDASKAKLAADLGSILQGLRKDLDIIEVTEGFGRIDALNRIGNQVFAADLGRKDNYVPINAPVSYPFIWTSSWFKWVQYDGSIMQPMIRNAGEALGVFAYLDTKSPTHEKRFASSIPLKNIYWIEKQLAGSSPYQVKKFGGLLAPKWPATIAPIDEALRKKGQALYGRYCMGCHLPPLNSEKIWKHFHKIEWKDIDGKPQYSKNPVLDVHVISHHTIGTDTAQGDVLSYRMVDTGGVANLPRAQTTPGMGLKADLCTWAPQDPKYAWGNARYASPKELVTVPFSDGGHIPFALALGAVVHQTTAAWYHQNYISPELQKAYQGDRPNCLQAGSGYKARPLNGIWATAPYLHNGSVPSLMDLLKPVAKRPKLVQLGSPRFDAENVGVYQDTDIDMDASKNYNDDGFFILDTSIHGNSNSGHEFSSAYNPDKPQRGVIGPALDANKRKALVEFLKTL